MVVRVWGHTRAQLRRKDARECVVGPLFQGTSNLVDPASSHTLVSKIKPCMCKYKDFYTLKLRTAHYISYSFFDNDLLLG